MNRDYPDFNLSFNASSVTADDVDDSLWMALMIYSRLKF